MMEIKSPEDARKNLLEVVGAIERREPISDELRTAAEAAIRRMSATPPMTEKLISAAEVEGVFAALLDGIMDNDERAVLAVALADIQALPDATPGEGANESARASLGEQE